MPMTGSSSVMAFDRDGLIGAHSRRHRSLRAARLRSLWVRRARWAIVAAMVLIGGYLAYQIFISGQAHGPALPPAPVNASDRIINPRFTGRDEKGVPFLVTAQNAVRLPGSLDPVAQLSQPIFVYGERVNGTSKEGSEARARQGVYDAGTRVLILRQDVALVTQSGYSFETNAADVHLNESRVEGNQYVFGRAPWGLIKAGGFEAFEQENRIVFNNGVRSRLYVDNSGAPQERPTSQEGQEP